MRDTDKTEPDNRNLNLFASRTDRALPFILLMLVALIALIAIASAVIGGQGQLQP